MTDIRIALAISHTPWIEGRGVSYARLIEQLDKRGPHGEPFDECVVAFHVEQERMPNPEWSERMWRWAVEQDCTHCLFLQDDVRVAPNFWAALRAMLEAHPDAIIGLQTLHPIGAALFAGERKRWVTTSDGLVGVGYCWPREELAKFLDWRKECLEPTAFEFTGGKVNLSEDTMQGIYCLVTGRRIFHPMPTIMDHDTALGSTYGNDDHEARRSPLVWERFPDLDLTAGWDEAGEVPHAGRFYEVSPFIAKQWVKGITDGDLLRMIGQSPSRELRRMNHKRLANGYGENPTRILLATPIRGSLSPGYAHSINLLLREPALEVLDGAELSGPPIKWQEDLVRVRSRFVSMFLHETDATHLLFVDADIIFEPRVVRYMLLTGKDFVTVPYPRRDRIDFNQVRSITEVRANAVAYRYSVRPLEGKENEQMMPGPDGCVEIASNGLGLTLLSRKGLEKMEAHYGRDPIEYEKEAKHFLKTVGALPKMAEVVDFAKYIAQLARDWPDLRFDDERPELRGLRVPTVALFSLMHRQRWLLSEDFSFCKRWRDMGEKVWLYLGPGSPVSHEGEWIYQGAIEAFGLQRTGE